METLASPTRQGGAEGEDGHSGDRLAVEAEETGVPRIKMLAPQSHSKLSSWYLHLFSHPEPSGHTGRRQLLQCYVLTVLQSQAGTANVMVTPGDSGYRRSTEENAARGCLKEKGSYTFKQRLHPHKDTEAEQSCPWLQGAQASSLACASPPHARDVGIRESK